MFRNVLVFNYKASLVIQCTVNQGYIDKILVIKQAALEAARTLSIALLIPSLQETRIVSPCKFHTLPALFTPLHNTHSII
jgi:hypothetical protein